MVVVAVEGPDCSGKSTFIEQLNNVLDLTRTPRCNLKFGQPDPPDKDPFVEYEQQLDWHDEDGDVVVVCDRLHWGERVYGPLLRGRDRLRLAGWRHVELSLAARGTLVVFINTESSAIARCLERRGDPLVGVGDLSTIEAGYRWCLDHTALPVLSLRHADDAAVLAVHALVDYMREVHSFKPPSIVGQSYSGSLLPDLLLFGEKRGGQSPHHGDRHAFVPRNSGSGRWLLEALPEDLWHHVGLANACDQDDPVALWTDLNKPPVVALGSAAHEQLTEHGIPHGTVPHPQFVRRFLHGRLEEYGELIRAHAYTTRVSLDWRGTVDTDDLTKKEG